MNSVLRHGQQQQAAEQRNAEHQDPNAEDKRRLHEADHDVGHDLAQHDLDRLDRHRQQALHGAALDLARHRQRRKDQHGHGEDGANEARHDVERAFAGRIVAGVGADLERRLHHLGNAAVMLQRRAHDLIERAHRRARGDRIGGVCRNQQRRTIAAPHRPLEIDRNLDRKQDLA